MSTSIGIRSSGVSQAGPSSVGRIGWIDAARGATMLLVVLFHADFMLDAVGERSMLLHLGVLGLYPLRMPLFFLIAGMLAAGILGRSARQVLVGRVAHYLWLWVVWILVVYGVFAGLVLPSLGLDDMGRLFQPRLNPVEHAVTEPSATWSWFLYALALFFALALAFRRRPAAQQLLLAIVFATPGLFGLGRALGVGVLDVFYYYPYFLAGVLGGRQIGRLAPRLGTLSALAVLGAIWCAATILAHKLGWLGTAPGRLALSFVALPAALGAANWVAHRSWARPFCIIGQNTLAIYVLHPMVLRLLIELERPDAVPRLFWALFLVLAATTLSLLLGQRLMRAPGLLALPGPLRRAFGAA